MEVMFFFNLIIPVYPNLFASVALPLYPIRNSEIPFILAYFVKVLNVIVLELYCCCIIVVLLVCCVDLET